MPTYEIGLDDGRKLRIDADDQEAALAGAQHFMANGPAAPSTPWTTGDVAGTAKDVARSIPTGAIEGLQGVAGAPGDIAAMTGANTNPDLVRARQNNYAGFRPLGAPAPTAQTGQMPTTADIQRKMGYTPYQPQTELGKIAQGASGMAAAGIIGGPEGVLSRIGAGAIGGAASEAAGAATEGTPLELPARVLAAVAAPGAAQRAFSRVPAGLSKDALKAAGDAGYTDFRSSGLQLDPQVAADYATRTKSELDAAGLGEEAASKVHKVLDKLQYIPQ